VRVLALNLGSSSVKAGLFDARRPALREVGRGKAELRGEGELEQALVRLVENLRLGDGPVDVVGHRVVHGGERLVAPVWVDAAVLEEIQALSRLAPLHQPMAVRGIRFAQARFPVSTQVAVFDTAFHARRPLASRRYALPEALTRHFGLVRYGFHGIAHASLVEGLAALSRRRPEEITAVALQLGHGCSACAVREGISIETSMGFTPLEGLVMATRAGDVDPGVLLHVLRGGFALDALDALLQRGSGLLGLAGSADMREVLRAEEAGDERARLAVELFVRRIVMVVGAYLTLLEGRGELVFGGGIGENAPSVRARIAAALRAWGVELDPVQNTGGAPGRISSGASRPVWVVPTDEERLIARSAAELVGP